MTFKDTKELLAKEWWTATRAMIKKLIPVFKEVFTSLKVTNESDLDIDKWDKYTIPFIVPINFWIPEIGDQLCGFQIKASDYITFQKL